MRDRLPDAPVGEARVFQVEAEVGVGIRRVLVLVVRLAERRVLGLPLELERREPGRVHALGLQLEEDGRLARNDAVHDPPEVRASLEVVGVGDEHHLLARLPFAEPVRAGADRVGPVLRRLAKPALAHVRLEQVPGQHPEAPALEGLRVGLLVADPQRIRIRRRDLGDRLEVLAIRRRRLRVDHRLVGEDHVRRGEGPAVVPAHVPAQVEGEIEAILAERPRLGELADDVEVLVAGDEPAVEHRADLERGAVAQHVRDQARDVPRQRLDEGVTVGGLLAGAGAPLLDRAVGLTAARRESEGGRERQRDDGERQLHAQRVWPGGAGATGAGAGAAGAGPPGVGTAGAGALGAHEGEAERRQREDDRDCGRDLPEDRRRPHRAEDRLGAGAAERGADVGALARLQQHDADDREGREDVDDDQRCEHPLTPSTPRRRAPPS